MKNDFKIVKNKLGFYEVLPKPSKNELQEYYNLQYFQNQAGNFRNSYSNEELQYFKNKEVQKQTILQKHLNVPISSLLDIGCGEGFTLKYFKRFGWNVTGIDFSNFGISRFNPEMEKYILQGDLIEEMKKLVQINRSFNVISMNNLLEHVVDPIYTIELAAQLLKDGGILIVEVPNDFSKLQLFLKEKNLVKKDYWVCYPDHLNYFTKESLGKLISSKSLKEVFSLSDFPIDLFLANIKSNYIMDRSTGKDAHNSRILIDNFLNEVSIEKTINLYASMADIGIGRQIISFFKK